MKDFARGEEVVRSMGNGAAIRRASMDIAEIRRAENRESSRIKIAWRIANGWSGSYLNRVMGNGRIRTDWLNPHSELAGIHRENM